MVDAASRSYENESANYNYDGGVDDMVSLHWLKIMMASARVPLRAPDGPNNTRQGRRPHDHGGYTTLTPVSIGMSSWKSCTIEQNLNDTFGCLMGPSTS